MSNTPLHDRPSIQTSTGTLSSAAAPRRLLICGGAEATAFVAQGFARTDYAAQTATLESAADFAVRYAPEIVMIELSADGTEAGLTLARRLRGDSATFNVPLVLLHHRDEATTRKAALAIGADDYFAITASRAEMLARLDALVWRGAVGRRTAPTAPDQQAEIDDFLVFVDHLRAHIKAGAAGTLALIEMQSDKSLPAFEASNGDAAPHTDNSNAKAFGYFKLRLRRMDALVFYGPTTLLIHLPQLDSAHASMDLARLCDEFCRSEPAARLLLGTATFPADGTEIEELIERAEARLGTPHAAGIATSSSNGNNSNGNSASGAHPHNRRKTDLIAAAAQHTATPPAVAPHAETATDQTSAPQKGASSAHDAARMSRDREAFSRAAALAAEEECALRARGVEMPQRILISVSDPARLAQLNSLVRAAGYEVRTAFAGQQALDLIRIERFDVLLVDNELYGVDGIETIRRLRRQERGRPALPVVLIVEKDKAEAQQQDAGALGIGGIVTLPYQPSDLLRSLRTARLAQAG